jgi:hypothetical protein
MKAIAGVAALVLAAASFAHHGVSTYRMDVVAALEGVVA